MTVYDRDMLEAIRGIRKELERIRKILTAEKAPKQIVFSTDGTITEGPIPDLETFFERLEDDAK